MKINILITLSLVILVNYAATLNILGIFPYEGKSHFFQFRIYLRELANRGHNVSVISYFPEKDSRANYKNIYIGDTKVLEDDIPVHKSYFTILATSFFLSTFGMNNCKAMVASKPVQDLVNSEQKFDVVVVEQFNSDCALGIAYKLGAPVVGMTSHVLMPFHYNRFGIPSNPAYVPFHFLEGGTNPSLYQRIERVIFDAYFKMFYKFVQWRDRNTLSAQFGDIPPLEDLAREIKILLLYQNFILTGTRLLPTNVIEVGGYHVAKAKPLTGDLKKFIDEAEHGVIYISFGSMIKSSTIPTAELQSILDVIDALPYRFIWRWDDSNLKVDKNKLYISDWLPQIDILAHPKTLAFMSHAGMGGTTESIHYGVPMVATPIFGDQPSNAFAIEESGLGMHLAFNDINKETLQAAFERVLDTKFRERVKEVSRAWHDRPMSPMDTAIYWTEFAARNSNLTLRSAAADKPLYQHLNLDVLAVFISLLAIIIYAFKLLGKNTRNSKTKTKLEADSKKGKKRSKKE